MLFLASQQPRAHHFEGPSSTVPRLQFHLAFPVTRQLALKILQQGRDAAPPPLFLQNHPRLPGADDDFRGLVGIAQKRHAQRALVHVLQAKVPVPQGVPLKQERIQFGLGRARIDVAPPDARRGFGALQGAQRVAASMSAHWQIVRGGFGEAGLHFLQQGGEALRLFFPRQVGQGVGKVMVRHLAQGAACGEEMIKVIVIVVVAGE